MMVIPPKEILEAIKICKPWEIYDKQQEKVIIRLDAPLEVKQADEKRKKWRRENYPDNY